MGITLGLDMPALGPFIDVAFVLILIPSISHPSLVITGKPAVTNDPNLQGDTITIARTFVTSTYCSSSALWTEMHMHT